MLLEFVQKFEKSLKVQKLLIGSFVGKFEKAQEISSKIFFYYLQSFVLFIEIFIFAIELTKNPNKLELISIFELSFFKA